MRFVFNKRKRLTTIAASVVTIGAQAAPYEVVDLGTLGGIKNFAFGVNSLYEVVGSSDGEILLPEDVTEENPGNACLVASVILVQEFCDQAYIYRNDSLNGLGQLNLDGSFGLSINDSSTIVGYAIEEVDDGDPDTINPIRERGFISYDGAVIESLPFPSESDNMPEGVVPEMRAVHISNDNIVLGYALVVLTSPTDETIRQVTARPYRYDLGADTFELIPLFATDADLFASGNQAFGGNVRSMNTAGQIVGWGNIANENGSSSVRGLFWDPSNPEVSQNLGTLGGFSSQAYDINDSGIIVGVSETDENFFRNEELAFVYDTSNETMTQIPEFSTIAEYTQSRAYAINNANTVVGSAQISANNGTNAAFIYEVGADALINLNDMIQCDLGWNLVTARDITEDGVIIGTGTLNGRVRSFMLMPTSDTTPTNCTKSNLPDDGDDGNDSGSSGGSIGYITLLALFMALYRRRISAK